LQLLAPRGSHGLGLGWLLIRLRRRRRLQRRPKALKAVAEVRLRCRWEKLLVRRLDDGLRRGNVAFESLLLCVSLLLALRRRRWRIRLGRPEVFEAAVEAAAESSPK